MTCTHKTIILSLFAFFTHTTFLHAVTQETTYIGTLTLPRSITKAPPFVAYYKGYRVPITDGRYDLRESHNANSFYFLFTTETLFPESTSHEDLNTIKALHMPEQGHYLCFKVVKDPSSRFTATFAQATASEKVRVWDIEKNVILKKHKHGLHIPENTIIVLVDPKHIKGLEHEESDFDGSVFKLPKIVFHNQLTAKTIADISTHALMQALDLDPFHRNPTTISETRTQGQAPVVLSITNE